MSLLDSHGISQSHGLSTQRSPSSSKLPGKAESEHTVLSKQAATDTYHHTMERRSTLPHQDEPREAQREDDLLPEEEEPNCVISQEARKSNCFL